MNTGDRYIIYTYEHDLFYAAAERPRPAFDMWNAMQVRNVCVMMPTEYPLTAASLPFLTRMWSGHNVLGSIYMCLRHNVSVLLRS